MTAANWQQIYIDAQERYALEIAAKDKEITRLQHLAYSSSCDDASVSRAIQWLASNAKYHHPTDPIKSVLVNIGAYAILIQEEPEKNWTKLLLDYMDDIDYLHDDLKRMHDTIKRLLKP